VVGDKYDSFVELARLAPEGSWRVVTREVAASGVLIVAPHGGEIENGTSELAAKIAGEEYSLYCFEGLIRFAFRELHVTSHRFDEPIALRLAARCEIVIGIHGCKGHRGVFIGGRDRTLSGLLTDSLRDAGFPAQSEGHDFPAIHPHNVCNRSRRGVGSQLEFTSDLRAPEHHAAIARSIREAIQRYQQRLNGAGSRCVPPQPKGEHAPLRIVRSRKAR
jgi:phage replication-related protein YjqB (UPF0714/DUF867 family)